jgi:integrase
MGLSSKTVESLQARPHARDVSDPGVRGLLIRVWPWGTKSWLFRYRWAGRPTRISLGSFPDRTLAEAREIAIEFRCMLQRGIDPRGSNRALAGVNRNRRQAIPRHRKGTLSNDAIRNADEFDRLLDASSLELDPFSFQRLAREYYRRYVLPNRKVPGYTRRILKSELLPVWKDRDARTIKPREVIELLDTVVDRGSPVMANRIAAVVKQLFLYGIQRAIVEDSPVKLLGKPGGKERPKKRALTADEMQAFVQNIDWVCRSRRHARVLMVLLLTPQRRGELSVAEWKEFDFDERTWRIPDEHAKAGRGHTLPLSDWAIAELKVLKHMAARSRFVLPATHPDQPADPKLISRSVARSLKRFKKIGVDTFTVHDLRRTGRTGLARLKVSRDIAERVLNHAPDKIEGTYDVFDYLDEKRVALTLWEDYLRQLKALPRVQLTPEVPVRLARAASTSGITDT